MHDVVYGYIVQGQLAALNDHDAANRGNKFRGAALKKEMTDLVAVQLMGKNKIIEPCYISFHWYISTNHDFDNIRFAAKYILDGMKKAGVLVDDRQKYVLGFGGDRFTKVSKGEEKILIEARVKNVR